MVIWGEMEGSMTERDKRVIMRAGHMLCHAKVDGVSIVTNGHVILPMEPFFENEEGDTVKPESVERYWRSIPERLAKSKPVRVDKHLKNDTVYFSMLSNDSQLNAAYLYLFDGCKVFSAGKREPAIFVRDGVIAGAVMPMMYETPMDVCLAPLLENVMARLRGNDATMIVEAEEEIRDKRAEIKDLEDEIAELQADIAKIRQRQEEAV